MVSAIIIFWVLLIYSLILTIIIIFMFTQTPSKHFLQAKLFKGFLLFKKFKGIRAMQFELAKRKTAGSVKAKSGHYYLSEDSGFFLQPGNIPCFLAPASIGQTVKIEVLEFLAALEEAFGRVPEDNNELRDMVKTYNSAVSQHKRPPLRIPSFMTVKPRDLDNLFRDNTNVDQQESLIEYEKRKSRIGDKLDIKHGIIIFIILIGLGVGLFLINKALTGNPCPACTCMYDVARNASTVGGMVTG